MIAAHKRRAAGGVSLEQQLRDVLAEAAKSSRPGLLERPAACRALAPPGPGGWRRISFAKIATADDARGGRERGGVELAAQTGTALADRVTLLGRLAGR